MENTEKYRIVDNEDNEVLVNVSGSGFSAFRNPKFNNKKNGKHI